MKCTPSGHKWAHVSCVLWIPEVSIGCPEKMEPITKISSIPPSRWSLVCVLCRQRKGACIQCSVKTCKTAYHVTCAFKHGLEMRAIIEDEHADDGVKLRSYCERHSVNSKKEKCPGSGSDDEEVKKKRRKDLTSEEKSHARVVKLHEIEGEFDRHVSVKDISGNLIDVDNDALVYIYNYWKLKRRAGHNRPLLPPKSDDADILSHRQEKADMDKMKMFVQLRQDLERVRNLCYMVSRREKLSRSFFRMREQTFHKQVAVLSSDVTGPVRQAILEANHGPSIYDRLYSHPDAPDHKNNFEALIAKISGECEEKRKDINGIIKSSKGQSNPYKKHYVNGSTRRSGGMYSGLSSEESPPENQRSTSKYRNRTIGSDTEDDKPSTSPKKISPSKGKGIGKKTDNRKKKVPISKLIVESSSEDEVKSKSKNNKCRSKTLRQMEKEMTAGQSGTDSDDLMPMRSSRNNKFPVDIYSDSSESGTNNKSNNFTLKSPSDPQQQLPRTKAAMKEFVPIQKNVPGKPGRKRGRKPSNLKDKIHNADEAKNKENIKFSKNKDTSDLIVPQRQAAKKASENMRSTTAIKAKDNVDITPEKHIICNEEIKGKGKVKSKGKESKESPTKLAAKNRNSGDSLEFDKEISETIAYVPQRQAAKKAAAHIKSGLGTKAPAVEANDDKKKDSEKETPKRSPKKDDEKLKSPQKSSSSSSSNSSSSSYSSSSSSEEEEEPHKSEARPCVKAPEIMPVRQPSLFSPRPTLRPTVDLHFLDKVSRPLSSTSASSDTETSKGSPISGSRSPSPKRIRPRRRRRSSNTNASSLKVPDKKLKTSERGPESKVPSPIAKREEPRRENDSDTNSRTRTRSITTSGNMSNKHDSRQRKSSKDEIGSLFESNTTPKQNSKSSELSSTQRKTDEAINKKKTIETNSFTDKPSTSKTTHRSSIEEKQKEDDGKHKHSPQKSVESKRKSISDRRISTKDPNTEYPKESLIKERRSSKYESLFSTENAKKHTSPTKTSSSNHRSSTEKKVSPPKISHSICQPDKNWFTKAPSPKLQPPPVEKPGLNLKYMTDDKSMDSDSMDKTSVRMIAKIQETLNENTMIKSPKTPLDARTLSMDHIDTPLSRNVRKRSTKDGDKKFINQDASNVQGVEISKSAKIPSAINTFPNRSIFSPQPRDNELFEIDMLAVDDGFNHDEIMKPFTYPEFIFKEDSKEDRGVQETLNLVEKLRMTLSTKKPPASESGQDDAIANDDKDNAAEIEESAVAVNDVDSEYKQRQSIDDLPEAHTSMVESDTADNHVSHNVTKSKTPDSIENQNSHANQNINDKWTTLPAVLPDSYSDTVHANKYLSKEYANNSYPEDSKDSRSIDVQSATELDRDNSKLSDDSQTISVVDHSTPTNDQESISQENQTIDNNNSLLSDNATISSPYGDRESKWSESKITQRRSSASSTDSETSVCSQKTVNKSHIPMNTCDMRPVPIIPEIDTYPSLSQYPCSMEPLPLGTYNPYTTEPPSFISALPLFPGPSHLPLPSPGGPLFPNIVPYSSTPLMPALAKPAFSTLCAAAFTSSSQNIALTTAMIAPPTPKPIDSPHDDIDIGSDKYSVNPTPSPTISVDSYNENTNRSTIPKHSTESSDSITVASLPEARSPPRPKTSAKFIGPPVKSPGRSPDISPKQTEFPKSFTNKKSNNKSNRGQRGRGRSKSRAHGVHNFSGSVDYLGNSIQSKLVGTVYDFDEEIANDSMDLKSLRERRKSTDVHDRKSENSYKDSSQSPRISPIHQSKKISPSEIKDKKVTSPTVETRQKSSNTSSPSKSDRSQPYNQPVVQPVLPGPVDMRTYQPFETPAQGEPFHSHLLATFASGTADQQLIDIDEEVEKQLHTALMASKPEKSPKIPPVTSTDTSTTQKYNQEVPLPKVSLSDSRNQLKVKIKGPFLDANYSSSIQPAAPQPPIPSMEPTTNIMGTPSAAGTSGMMSGTTNLRRMRKKELLRQYWTQDMNMDDPSNASAYGSVPTPVAPPPLSRAVITIPKAVSSMTSIPTREDYKGVSEPHVEKKKRKTTSGLSRELRHLEVSMNDDVEPSDDIRLSNYTSTPASHKRKPRVSNKPNQSINMPSTTPKLKIKIGSNFIQPVNVDEPLGDQFRPPKKRLASLPKPSLEDLRRESMKYRKMVMADFEENEKLKKHKLKTEKRKRKKDKKSDKVQVTVSDSDSATKLIIKFKRTKDGNGDTVEAPTTEGSTSESKSQVPIVLPGQVDPFEYDPTAPDPLAIDPSVSEASSAMRKIRTSKVTPIRLKLSRSAEGSSYVMDNEQTDNEKRKEQKKESQLIESSLPVSKHCEVR